MQDAGCRMQEVIAICHLPFELLATQQFPKASDDDE